MTEIVVNHRMPRASLSAAEMGDLSFVDVLEMSGATRDNKCSKPCGDILKYLSREYGVY